MDIFSLRWFVAGIFFSLPLHWLYISVRPKISKMQFEDRLATNTITQILGLVIVVGGFAFSIYGNYLTAKAGGGKVTTDQFNTLANQFLTYFQLYVGLIWSLMGIAVGTGIILMIRSAWRYFSHKQTKSKNNQDAEQDVVVSTKELKSTITKIEDYKKAKTDLDEFFKYLNDEANDNEGKK